MPPLPLSRAIARVPACALGVFAASTAAAIGFGPGPDSVAYGRPLDLSIALQLAPGDPAVPGCLAAQVLLGEQRLPPQALQLHFEPGAGGGTVRLRSAVVVREPMVTVDLRVGCKGAASRRFVVFADPSRADAVPVAAPPKAPGAVLRNATLAGARDGAALAEAAQAAQAAHAAQAAAEAAEARVDELQAAMRTLRAQADASQENLQQLRDSLAQAEARSRQQPLGWALAAVLAASTFWFGWRLRRVRVEAVAAAAGPHAAAAGAAPAGAQHERARSGLPNAPPLHRALAPVAVVPPDPPPAEPPDGGAGQAAAGADELIDLEQQVDFFLALGEADSAIDLLLAHLRSGGGNSPVPYLRLLEIHRSRGDDAGFERTRARFSRRFRLPASADGHGPDGGRELIEYPQVLTSLQRCWPAPADAMTELEDLLFLRSGDELLDLPAYRDVLLLYAVARDRLLAGRGVVRQVDLLLPDEGDEPPCDPFVTAALPSSPMPLAPAAPAHQGRAPPPMDPDPAPDSGLYVAGAIAARGAQDPAPG